jgi:hypothetical protein
VSIFRRGKKADQAQAADVEDSTDLDPAADAAPAEDAADVADDRPEDVAEDAAESEGAAAGGPFDVADVEGPEGRLDLGSLWLVGVPGMELRLEIEEATSTVVGATAVLGDSAVQLQAFAAPKTLGLWDEIRGEIAESIVGQGGTADEERGRLGVELRTRMPSAGPDGRTVFAPARFVGVDGPRWFLRAVFSGRAAIDDAAADTLFDVVRGTVVVRGDAAMAPRELLPLRLPAEAGQPEDEDAEGDSGAGRSTDDLQPFERGPEITEIR